MIRNEVISYKTGKKVKPEADKSKVKRLNLVRAFLLVGILCRVLRRALHGKGAECASSGVSFL